MPGTPRPSNSPERKSASVNKGEGVVKDCGGKTKRKATAGMTGGGVCSGQEPFDNRLRPLFEGIQAQVAAWGKNHPRSSGFSSAIGGGALGLAGDRAGSRQGLCARRAGQGTQGKRRL